MCAAANLLDAASKHTHQYAFKNTFWDALWKWQYEILTMDDVKFEKDKDKVMVEISDYQFSYHGLPNGKLISILPKGKWKGKNLQLIAQDIFDSVCKSREIERQEHLNDILSRLDKKYAPIPKMLS